MKKLIVAAALAAMLAGIVTSAGAQNYPSRPITIIVPFAAGGPTDVLARMLGDRMRQSLGQTDPGRECHRRRRHARRWPARCARRPTAIR